MQGQKRHIADVAVVRRSALTFIALSWLTCPLAASAASFDCKLAKTYAERSVCSDPALSQLDDDLARAYKRASQSPQAYPNLRADQHSWLGQRAACQSAPCLTAAYQSRLAQLQTAHCTAKVMADSAAIENPDGVLKRGGEWGPVTQVRVNKKTGAMTYCAHGDYCYPATTIEISSCLINAKPDASDDEEWIYNPF